MAYSVPHTFYVDYLNGSDATRTTLIDVVFSQNGTGVRGTYAGHGLVNGAIITVSGCTRAYANDQWEVENVTENTFDLVDALWVDFNGADVTGNVVPFGGSSWADAWLTCYAGGTSDKIKPGVTFKVAKSPAPFSLGKTGVWNSPTTAGGMPSAKPISSSTNATPIQINCNAHGLVDNDLVYIYNHQNNFAANGCWKITKVNDNAFTLNDSVGTASGSSGYFVKANTRIVELASAETQLLDECEQAWTAANSATCSVDSSSATGYNSVTIAKSSPANSTLYGYKSIPEVDLSGYQGICLWFYSVAVPSVNAIYICLCSDTAGATVIDTFKIPAFTYPVSYWIPLKLTKDGGGNLGASIKSIALYSGSSAPTNISIRLDNINACKSSGLALPMLISKNTAEQGGDEGWWTIGGIWGKFILLATTRGYYGTTETVTTYARETSCPISAMPSSAPAIFEGSAEAGADGTANTISGGWNTSSGLQDGETFLDGLAQYGCFTPAAYTKIDHMNFCRLNQVGVSNNGEMTNCQSITGCYHGVYVGAGTTSDINTVKNIIGCKSYGLFAASVTSSLSWDEIKNLLSGESFGVYQMTVGGTHTKITNCCNNGNIGIYLTSDCDDCRFVEITNLKYNINHGINFSGTRNVSINTIGNADYNGQAGITLGYTNNKIPTCITIGSLSAQNNGNYGVSGTTHCGHIQIGELTTSGNGTAAIQWANGELEISHGHISEADIVYWYTSYGYGDKLSYVGIAQYGDTAGRFYREGYRGIITDPVTAGETAAWSCGGSGNCLYINPNSTTCPIAMDFYIPCTAAQGIQAHFQVRTSLGTPDPNPTLNFSAMGAGITPIFNASVTLTESWAEYISDTMTPAFDGFIRCRIEVCDGSISGDVGIGDIHYAEAV